MLEAAITAPIIRVTIDKVLLGQLVEGSKLDGVHRFVMRRRAKCPAAATRTLVLNLVNHSEVSPINVGEVVSEGPHDSRCTVRGHTMGRAVNWAYLRAF